MGLHTVSRLPLPQLTFDNAFFWTSGADGQLRIQECGDCRSLIHPPQPVCRYCKSHNMGVRAVSGRAVLSAFTVNHRFAMPGLSAPYVVAQVAIEEDPRVRLTTNIVECDPDELELGRVVEVVSLVARLTRGVSDRTSLNNMLDDVATRRDLVAVLTTNCSRAQFDNMHPSVARAERVHLWVDM